MATILREEVKDSLLSADKSSSGFLARFRFSPHLTVFRGHYPGSPLVPGVYLLEAVRTALEQVLMARVRIAELRDVKFTAVVEPGQEVSLEAEWVSAEMGECRAIFHRGGDQAARIVLRMEHETMTDDGRSVV